MFSTKRALVSTQKPTFYQSGNAMNAGHADVSRVSSSRKNNSFVTIAATRQLVVAAPSIGQNCGAPFDDVANERNKARPGYVRNSAQPQSSETFWEMNFQCDNHDILTFRTASSFSTRFAASNVRFVHFNMATKFIPIGTDHRLPQLVQPRPCRLITSQTKNTFQTQSTRSVFLAGYKPHCCKPNSQRNLCPLEDSPRRHRNLTSALPTMKIASTCRPRFRFPSAPATLKSFWPTTTQKITAACRFIGKPFQELLVSTRVVLSGHWIQSCIHTKQHYMLWVLASSGYPPNLIYISTIVKHSGVPLCQK